jgi:hypothetical protein
MARAPRDKPAMGLPARRKMPAASSAEDALANLAKQCAARQQSRQCRGSFFRRRRRFAAPLKCTRMAKFHNTILHPYSQGLALQYSSARLLFSSSLHEKLTWTLPHQSCGKHRAPVAL